MIVVYVCEPNSFWDSEGTKYGLHFLAILRRLRHDRYLVRAQEGSVTACGYGRPPL